MAIKSIKANQVEPGDQVIIAGKAVLVTSIEPTRTLSGSIDGYKIQTTGGLKVIDKNGEILVAREESSTSQIESAQIESAKIETNQNSRWFFRGSK